MKKLTFTILTFVFSTFMWGQDIKFEVQISSDSILVGNYFEIRFSVENIKGKFEAPTFQDFQVISGPNQSSSMQIINGEMTQSYSYSYFLKPQEIGNYSIPPAYLVLEEDEVLETPPIDILVVPNPDGIIQKPDLDSKSYFNPFPNNDRMFDRFKPKPKKKKLKEKKI